MIGPNRLKQKLKAGEFAVGPVLSVNAPWLVDLAGPIGFDFIMVDAEHGPLSPESADYMFRAAEAAGVTAMVRVSSNTPSEILRYLDIGAAAIQVPHIDSADDAKRAVAAVKYPPLGDRGLAGSTRAAGYGVAQPLPAYVDAANRETMVLAMIESPQAVERIDEIMAVEGIDALALGPSDIASAMGHKGARDVPEVDRAIDHVLARAKARRMPASLPAGNADAIRACRGRGATFAHFAMTTWIVQACGKAVADGRS